MEQYKNVFTQTERVARDLLDTITRDLRSHMDLTTQGYEKLVAVADEHFSNAANNLKSSADALGEFLEELNESLGVAKGKTDGRA